MAARCCRSLGRINCVAPERGSQRRVACFGWFRLHLGDSQYHDLFSDVVDMLGAICGSAQSMDCAAQSVDPYIAQESMDCAGICGSSWAIHEFCV